MYMRMGQLMEAVKRTRSMDSPLEENYKVVKDVCMYPTRVKVSEMSVRRKQSKKCKRDMWRKQADLKELFRV